MYTDTGQRDIEAPATFVSDPGTKRVVLAHEHTVWTTIHTREDTTDLDLIEDFVIAKSYDELAALGCEMKGLPCLG